jgi:hypothetical protein
MRNGVVTSTSLFQSFLQGDEDIAAPLWERGGDVHVALPELSSRR